MNTATMRTGGRDRQLALTSRWIQRFRDLGYNPLPADEELRRPVYGFRKYWEEPAPQHVYDNHPSLVYQVMTGRFWGLIVFDLDGPLAVSRFEEICAGKVLPSSWRSKSGGGGLHLWFTIPRDWPVRMPAGALWIGEGKHNRIDRLCDHSLVVAPPSIHHRTKQPYSWESGCSPLAMERPARCPNWLLEYPTVHEVERRNRPKKLRSHLAWSHIPKVDMARRWGLKFTGTHRDGWHECHAFGRDDNNPSAAVHEESGFYKDFAGPSLTFPELAVALGAYPNVEEALRGLANGN